MLLSSGIDDLTLLSGRDIYDKELNLIFHQPKLIDIAAIGLSNWDLALSIFFKDKYDIISQEPKLEDAFKDATELQVTYFLLQLKNEKGKYFYDKILSEFALLVFPEYTISIHQKEKQQIVFFHQEEDQTVIIINEENFSHFKEILKTLFRKDVPSSSGYNINKEDPRARRIVAQLEERHKILAKNDQKPKHSVFHNKISSLGLEIGLDKVFNLTLYQFYEQYGRFQKRKNYDQGYSALLAGAKDIDLESWEDEI